MKKNYESGIGIGQIPKKLLLVMKLTALLLVVFTMHVTATVYSQSTKLSLNMQERTIKEVLQQIENQSEYRFIYENEKVNLDTKVSIRVKDEVVENILKKLFEKDGINYSITDSNMILINPSESQMKRFSKEFINGQQQKSISGKVTDSSGASLPGVTVVVKGTANGTITDANGSYSLANVPANAKLQFSFVGMKMQEVIVGNKQTINITLEDETIGLAEVVAVGYGTQKKAELTSAISSVKNEDIKICAVATLSEALQGKSPGVEVINNSNSPGGDVSVRIRGISSLNNSIQPLYVVDGVPLSGGVSFLNNNDIASVEILKDAAASSIYGSRGANGVVLITTNKGGFNEKFSITADASVAFQSPTHLIDMMKPAEYAQMLNAFHTNDGSGLTVPSAQASGAGTDWTKEISRNNAPLQNYNITLSGGSNKVEYSSSLSYYNQKGVAVTSDYEKMNYRLNTQVKVTDKLKVGTGLVFTSSKRHLVPNEGDLWHSIFNQALTIDPITPVYKTAAEMSNAGISSNMNSYSVYHAGIYTPNSQNPAGMAGRNFQEQKNTSIFGNLFGSYEIVHGLVFKSSFGFEYNEFRYNKFNPDFYESPNSYLLVNNLAKNENALEHFTFDNTLTYTKRVNDHSLILMAGTSYEHSKLTGINAFTAGLPGNAENYRYLSYGTSGTKLSETTDESALNSYFARAMYNYKLKYFI